MPTYEYRCPEGHDFEKFTLKMSDAQAELPCPTCGKAAPRRVSAGGGLLFKGSGFYITDYGKDGKKDQRAAAAKSESAAKSEPAGKTESTAPATTAAPAPGSASGGGASGKAGTSGPSSAASTPSTGGTK